MTERDQSLIGLLAVVVALALALFGLKPLLASYALNRLAVAARRIEVANLEVRKTELESLASLLAGSEEQLKELDLALPSEAQFPELLVQLKTLAERSNLTLISVSPASLAAAKGGVAVSVSLRGGFPNLVTMASLMATNLRPIALKSINLVKAGESQDPNRLAMTLELTFARLPAGTAGDQS